MKNQKIIQEMITSEKIRNLKIMIRNNTVYFSIGLNERIYPLVSIIEKCESIHFCSSSEVENIRIHFAESNKIEYTLGHETEPHCKTIDDVFSHINKSMKVTFSDSKMFEKFDTFMENKGNWYGLYPRKVIIDQLYQKNNNHGFPMPLCF